MNLAKKYLWMGIIWFALMNASGAIFWRHSGTILVRQSVSGVDITHGAVPPQDASSSNTLYFKFRVDPISDAATKSIADFDAGFVFFEKGQEHVGIGNSRQAWAYCAMNVPRSKKGYVDFNSAKPEPGFGWQYIRAGTPVCFVFKVEYVPGQDDRITVWLDPNLSLDATEFNQTTNIITRFEANATFDEIHLVQRGGSGGGWKFSDLAVATSFADLLEPHFWQQKWFPVIIIMTLIVVVALAVQLLERRRAQRQIRILEQERAVASERARIARDIHDELGASLTKICKLAEILDRQGGKDDKINGFPQMISDTARNTIQTMDEIVWAVNPKNDTLKEMADYLVYFMEDFLRPSGIVGTLDIPLALPDVAVSAEIRHNLFMVLKEALNNAVKHGAPSRVKLGLAFQQDHLMIELSDDGKGFDLDESAGLGNGLANMRKRVGEIGGELQLQSRSGVGTSVKVQVPLGKIKTIIHE